MYLQQHTQRLRVTCHAVRAASPSIRHIRMRPDRPWPSPAHSHAPAPEKRFYFLQYVSARGCCQGQRAARVKHALCQWRVTSKSMPHVKWLCHFSRQRRDEGDTASQITALPRSFDISFRMAMTAAVLRYLRQCGSAGYCTVMSCAALHIREEGNALMFRRALHEHTLRHEESS